MTSSQTPEPFVTQIRQLLRDRDAPEKLNTSPLLVTQLIQHTSEQFPALPPARLLHHVLDQLYVELKQQEPLAADLLHGRFWEGLSVSQMVQRERPESQSTRRFYQQQDLAMKLLAQLWQQSEAHAANAVRERDQHLLNRLPVATYAKLFGIDLVAKQITARLLDRSDRSIVVVKGIGGIGKTALADHVVRTLVQQHAHFEDVHWVSAKQEFLTLAGILQYRDRPTSQISLTQIFDDLGETLGLPAVKEVQTLAEKMKLLSEPLRTEPHLVVIDNLETVADFQTLVPWLADLGQPSRFLLTSRMTVPSLARVTTVDLDELDTAAGIALAKQIAKEKQVAACDCEAVYELVGGNPLAIILVVSLMRQLPPVEVLAAIRRGAPVDLYNYIYRQSWSVLTQGAKELLFTIQRAGDVADWRWLALVTGGDADALRKTLLELLDMSLVNCQCNAVGAHQYTIHRLTSTFLRTEILGWR